MLSREPPTLPVLLRQWWFLPLLVLALCLRLYGLSDSALWGDETSSLFLARYSPVQLWQHAAHDVHPPLYFFLLHAWVAVAGEGVLSLRSFSAVFGTFAVFLGGWLVWRLASPRATFIAVLLLAMLPTAVRYSQEVRMYSLLGCWLLAATLALLYWRQVQRRRYLLVYVALMTAAFYTHYFSLFGALVQWLAQSDGNELPWPVLLGVPLLLVAAAALVLRADRSPQRGGVLLALYCGMPLLLLYGISFISPVFVERYLTAFALGLPLLLALALDRLLDKRRALGTVLLVTLLGLQGLGVGRAIAIDPDEQFDGMAAYVNAHYRAGDRVVVDDILWYLTFRYYNQTGHEPLLYTAPAADGSSGRPGRYGFGSLIDDRQHAFVDHLADLPQDQGRVWLVMSRYNDQEIPDVPATWKRVAQHAGGEVQAILFERTAQRNAAR